MSVILSAARWPSLAQDLAIMTAPGSPLTELNLIYKTYGISDTQLKEILTIPSFQTMFSRALDEVKADGKAAGPKYRFSTLSQSLAEKLYRDASTNTMESKDAVKLLELLLKAAGLADSKTAEVHTQVNVGVALPLPQSLRQTKLSHAFPVLEAGA